MFFRLLLKVPCLIVIVVLMLQLAAADHQHDNDVHFVSTHSHFGDSSHVHFDHIGRSSDILKVDSIFKMFHLSIFDSYFSLYKSTPISSIDRPPELCL